MTDINEKIIRDTMLTMQQMFIDEHLPEFDDEERTSSCCGYPADEFEDYGICGFCREHCDYTTEAEDNANS